VRDVNSAPWRNLKGFPHGSLYAAIAAGVLLRIVWAALIPVVPVSDGLAYDTFARNLVAGQGFGWEPGEPSGFFSPGASFIYAAVYWLFGPSYGPIVALHVLVSALTILLVGNLASGWFGPRAGAIAAWSMALWPSQVMFVTVLATELLFNFLLVLVLWIWLDERWNIWCRALLAGSILALSALVRPHALLLPFLLGLERMARTRRWIASVGAAAIAGLVMLALIQPWAMRNEQAFGQRFLVSANFGVTLWMGNNPASRGAYVEVPADVKDLNDAQRNDELMRRAVTYIQAEPGTFLYRSVMRVVQTHGYETINVAWNIEGIRKKLGERALMPLKLVSTAFWYAALIAGLAGAVLLFRRHGVVGAALHPTILLWAYFAGIHAVILSQDRYHFISIPLIASLAGLALATALERIQTGRSERK
jgi:hypothetical protein